MKHEIVEKNLGLMIILIILTISGGFLVEVVPTQYARVRRGRLHRQSCNPMANFYGVESGC